MLPNPLAPNHRILECHAPRQQPQADVLTGDFRKTGQHTQGILQTCRTSSNYSRPISQSDFNGPRERESLRAGLQVRLHAGLRAGLGVDSVSQSSPDMTSSEHSNSHRGMGCPSVDSTDPDTMLA